MTAATSKPQRVVCIGGDSLLMPVTAWLCVVHVGHYRAILLLQATTEQSCFSRRASSCAAAPSAERWVGFGQRGREALIPEVVVSRVFLSSGHLWSV